MKKRAKVETTKWAVVDYLKTNEDITAYMEAAMEDGNPALIAKAKEDIARAKKIKQADRIK